MKNIFQVWCFFIAITDFSLLFSWILENFLEKYEKWNSFYLYFGPATTSSLKDSSVKGSDPRVGNSKETENKVCYLKPRSSGDEVARFASVVIFSTEASVYLQTYEKFVGQEKKWLIQQLSSTYQCLRHAVYDAAAHLKFS